MDRPQLGSATPVIGGSGTSAERPSEKLGTGLLYRPDALRAIDALDAFASARVRTGVWLHIGHWFHWPGWLVDGTNLDAGCELPHFITASDDLLIAANVFDNCDLAEICRLVIEQAHPPLNPRGTLLRSAPDAGELLRLFRDSLIPANPTMEASLHERKKRWTLIVKPTVPIGNLHHPLILLCLLTVCKSVQGISSSLKDAISIETIAPTSPGLAATFSKMDAGVRLGCQRDCVHVSAKLVTQVNPERDTGLWQSAKDELEAFIRDFREAEIIGRTRSGIVELLLTHGRVPRLKQVAAHMDTSARTLTRRLAEQSTTFHNILEEELRSLTIRLISEPNLTLQEISERLGFTDRSSFGRSFKKWFGDTPANFRRSASSSDHC